VSGSFVRSFPIRQRVEESPQAGFPSSDACHEKFNSRPVAPTPKQLVALIRGELFLDIFEQVPDSKSDLSIRAEIRQ
jgi:hypothetical protein